VVAFIREMRTADGETLPHDAALKDFVDLKQGALDRESQERLDTLKRKVRDNLGPKQVKTYSARWDVVSARRQRRLLRMLPATSPGWPWRVPVGAGERSGSRNRSA
jgi:hypothetical protein